MLRRSPLAALLLIVLLALTAGCASGVRPSAMVPQDFSVAVQSSRSVHASVSGADETDPMWGSQLSSSAFHEALVAAIQRSGVFATVVSGPEADYQLRVRLVDLDQPFAGFNMTVGLTCKWTLVNEATGDSVMEATITSEHTAKVGDSLVGVKRLRIAREGAARENIREGIERVSRLTLD